MTDTPTAMQKTTLKYEIQLMCPYNEYRHELAALQASQAPGSQPVKVYRYSFLRLHLDDAGSCQY